MHSYRLSYRPRLESLERREQLDGAGVILNPSFEEGLSHWAPQGAEPQLTLVSTPKRDGLSSLRVTNRVADWQGVRQSLMGRVQANQDYEISAWVRLVGQGQDTLKLQMMVEDSAGVRFVNIASQSVGANWVRLVGGFRLETRPTVRLLELQVIGAQPGRGFFVDQFNVVPVDWRSVVDARIESLRKRDVSLTVTDLLGNPVAANAIEVRQLKNEFGFGSAIDAAALNVPEYAEFFAQNFEWATPENAMKWRFTESQRDNENYTDADAIVNFAKQNDIQLRGHTAFWGTYVGNPDWVMAPNGTAQLNSSELADEVDERLDSLVTRYASDVKHWEVVNEAMALDFFEQSLNLAPGNDFQRDVFQRTQFLDPDALLFTNEFGIISGDHLADEYRTQILSLQSRGVNLGGIGVQGHMDRGISSRALELDLQALTDLNLPIWITEFDVVNPNVADRALDLEIFYRTMFSLPQVKGIVMWGFWAQNHWLGPTAALVSSNWTINPAGQKYLALRDEWSTEVNSSGSQLDFRGFHGDYEVRIVLTDGTEVTYPLNVSSSSSTRLTRSLLACSTTVTTTNDDGPGSLRSALACSNVLPGQQTIRFSLSGSGPFAIFPQSPLPIVTDSVILDGRSQPGYSAAPLITLDGSLLIGAGQDGLTIAAGDSRVHALAIANFSGDGLVISNGNGALVTDSYFGLLPNGSQAGNQEFGIRIQSSSANQIGTSAHGNFITGNRLGGIAIQGASAVNNVIRDNVVGLLPVSFAASNRQPIGIHVIDAPSNSLGIDGSGNVIAGNAGDGIVLGSAAQNTKIVDNLIGVDPTGVARRANSGRGMAIASNNNLIRNNVVVSSLHGVQLQSASGGNVLTQNYIGIDRGQIATNLGSNWYGVYLTGTGSNNLVSQNAIEYQRVGIRALTTGTGNRFSQNRIRNNVELGIDLGVAGANSNDPGDGDTGTNRLQNSPVLTVPTLVNSRLRFHYQVDSLTTNAAYPLRVEFFLADARGQGRLFIGQHTYISPGNKLVNLLPGSPVALGDALVAVATDALGNSSEYSSMVIVGGTLSPIAATPQFVSPQFATAETAQRSTLPEKANKMETSLNTVVSRPGATSNSVASLSGDLPKLPVATSAKATSTSFSLFAANWLSIRKAALVPPE